VVVDTGTTWDSLTESNFASYSAIILGDPSCGTSASSAIGAAVSDASTWSPAITGNVIVAGNAPVAAENGANPTGPNQFTDDAVSYALAGGSSKTGLYVSLSCYYAASSSGTSVPVLGSLGTFTVGGGIGCSDSGTVNMPVEDGVPSFHGLTQSALLGWSCSVDETFDSWPSGYHVLAVDHSATPSDFSGPGGLTGQPYVLVNNAGSSPTFTGAVGGDIPRATTYGEKDPAAPGIGSGMATVGNGVNAATGDFATTATDASAATYGPALSIERTYDADLAQAEEASGTASDFGYGWSSNVGASLSFGATANDIYTVRSGFNTPDGEAVDSAGNVYIADSDNNRIEEIAATTHTQWGIAMTGGNEYVIAGSTSGTAGFSGDGSAATAALLDAPVAVALDASGDLYISDVGNYRVREIAASSGTQWGISMTADDIYTVAGTGAGGCGEAEGLAATSRLIVPGNVAFDSAGDMYISDEGENRVLELAKHTGTQWGVSMTADDTYVVAGGVGCASGHSGDDGPAVGSRLDGVMDTTVDGSGDLLITDTENNRIQEVAGATGTQWGISMTADDIYTIAGSSSGTSGDSGDDGAATAALLLSPEAVVSDAEGNLYIADTGNARVQEVASTTHTQWGISMTADDIYTIAGSASRSTGDSGDGGAATSALLFEPQSLAFDPAGNLYILDAGNNNIREVAATSSTTWADSPTSPITVNQASGAQVTFVPPISGSCPSPDVGPGTTGTYCAPPYATATITYSSTANTYTFVTHPYEAYTFNGAGQLTSETTPGGASSSISYDTPMPGTTPCLSTASSCDTVTSASGRTLTLGVNAQGLITTVTDPLGNTWLYSYSGGNLTSVTDPLGRVTSYTYDTSNSNPTLTHDLLTVTEPNGQSGGSHAGAKLQNTYDSSGRVTSQTDPDAFTTTLYYGYMNETTGNGSTITEDSDGNYADYAFETGVLDAKEIALNSALPEFTYYTPSTTTLLDSSVVDPDGGITNYTYDTDGNTLTKTNPLGEETTNSYNSFDEPTCMTKPMASSPCSSLSPPTAVAPGGSITPPSSAPPAFTTYSRYDTNGNLLWQSQGVYEPGSTTAAYSQTTYDLFAGNSVTLGSVNDSCGTTPPNGSLPCATIDANGDVTQLSYDSAGDVTSSSIPDGNGAELATTTNTYDSDGNKVSTTAPAGNLSGANAANYTTTATYDADHEPLVVTLGGGSGSTVAPTVTATYYDANGNSVATTDASGNPYSSSNPSGCNPLTTSSCSGTTYNTFTADNQETLVTDPEGNQTLTCFDGDGNQAESVPPWGVAAYSLTPASCPTSYPSGYSSSPLASDATMITFDAQGKQLSVTAPPATGETTRTTTTYLYDAAEQVIETTAPPSAASGGSNQVTFDTYDLAGESTSMTTGFGTASTSTSTSCYDPDGDQTATVPGNGNSSGITACETSSPWQTSSPDQTISDVDSVGETVTTTSPPPAGTTSPATTTNTYDPDGNQLSTTDPSGDETTYTYNPLGDVVSTVESGQNSTDYYNANGNVLATTAPGGNPYSAGNPTGCNPLTTTTCSYTTYNTYNSSNELLTSTNPDGDTTTNYYDTSGNKIATTGPSGNPTTCNPTTSTTPCADTTTHVYNSLNQLTCEAEPNSASDTCSSPGSGVGITTFTYTADGKRQTMTNSTGTTNYSYDTSDRLISMTNASDAAVTYGYGQNSDPTCVSYPNSSGNTCTSPGSGQGVATYSYNQANQLTSISDWSGNLLSYSYNANGDPDNISINSGSADVTTSYDDDNNISSIDATGPSSTNLLDLNISRASNGDMVSDTAQVGSTVMATDNYGYNSLNQVTSGPISGTSGSDSYSYNADGDIAQDTTTFSSAAYDQADQLCWTSSSSSSDPCSLPPAGAITYSSNSDGDRTLSQPAAGNPASYGWDTARQTLMCVNTDGTSCSTSSPTSTTTVYTYNGDGVRASSTQNSTTTNYIWDVSQSDQDPRLFSDGTWDYLYVPGSSVPIEQVSASGSSPTADLLVSDPSDSVRGLIQLSAGTQQYQLVNYTDYDAYGNPITESGGGSEAGGLSTPQTAINADYVGSTPFGFGGGYTDPTGLVYLLHRYYDPTTGQFISVDPLVSETDQAYSYAGDDPVNISDPSGEAPDQTLGCGAGSLQFSYEAYGGPGSGSGRPLGTGNLSAQVCVYIINNREEVQFNIYAGDPTDLYGYLHAELVWSSSPIDGWASGGNLLCNTTQTHKLNKNKQCSEARWANDYYYGRVWASNGYNAVTGYLTPTSWTIVAVAAGWA
jgi:RHS repeat-associated protein